jgi:hypothetical protein
MSEDQIQVAESVRTVEGPRGLRLIGEANEIQDACNALRLLAELPAGSVRLIDGWQLDVTAELPRLSHERCVAYSAKEWAVAAGVFMDAVCGRNASPLDFGDVGFGPRSSPDIGISLIGAVRYDWQGPSSRRAEISVPSLWPRVRTRFELSGYSALLRMATASSWTADLISLESGEILQSEYTSDESLEGLVTRLASPRLQR